MFNRLVIRPPGLAGSSSLTFRSGQSVPADDPEATGQSGAAAQPVRIAVCDGVDRFAVQYDPAQADRLFSSVGILLSEALSSAASPIQFRSQPGGTPTGPGRVVRLPGRAPVGGPIRLDGRGRQQPSLTATARQLAVAQDLDGGVSCTIIMNQMACIMPVKRRSPTPAIYGRAGFRPWEQRCILSLSWRRTGAMPGWPLCTACSPPPRRAPGVPLRQPPLLPGRSSALQAAVSFQTQSDALYEIPGGLRLRVEDGNSGDRRHDRVLPHLRTRPPRYPIGTTDGYTVSELVETTRRLAADTVGASRRCPTLPDGYHRRADGTTEVCYGYSLSGAAVLLPEDGCAARFTVRNGQIIDYTLRFRRYEGGETGAQPAFFPSGRPPPRWRPCLPRGRELVVFIRIMAVTLWRPAGPPDRNDAL